MKKKMTYEEELKKRYPRNTKLQKMLLSIPEQPLARFSLDSIDPDDVIAEGEYTFVRELYRNDRISAKNRYTVYESKKYTNPTYRDAWREFKKAQVAVYHEVGGDFNHVFLEEVGPIKKGSKKLGFGTGS